MIKNILVVELSLEHVLQFETCKFRVDAPRCHDVFIFHLAQEVFEMTISIPLFLQILTKCSAVERYRSNFGTNLGS